MRTIYYHHVAGRTVSLLAIYAKGEQEDLSAADKMELRELAGAIDAAEKARLAAEAARKAEEAKKRKRP